MHPICKVYLRICRKWGPRHGAKRLTVSAWLWRREIDTGRYLLRQLVDDWFMVFRDQPDHCATCFLRESANPQPEKQ
jgi:hypothetical protein